MASFIEDIFGKLFPKKDQRINIKENFTQTEDQKDAVEEWLVSEEGIELLALIEKNYHFKNSGMNNKPEVHILKSPYANGFAVSYEEPLTEESFSNLFFAFGRRMLDLGYSRVSLDRKIEEVNDNVKTTEKQYFKPPLSNADFSKKIDQLYGNVSIEKVSINDKPNFLKVLVTVYSDHLYKNADPFEEFIDNVFQNKS
ncbi:hypothetical protein A33Q_2088 [Indibacter alkaliphilus LW1]|jgi:hypothetical protein|uniref:Uncharacterized protein n=1 Tax=Indibacter alkaliphilus (strain CCUG 57479 / KCTC 22604 / LW1) TaxID=1189612 RepID=S2E3K4_INDAL|nr:hypothetical protein [Indibacter alkaliphilus]EOZ96778.1 hypothetical protein A33Q_2088 [Indibacter alkaliphilus LW1]